MKKLLIIISSAYPYRKSEDYLSNETAYISNFDEVICFPTTVYGEKGQKDIINYPIPPQYIKIYNSKHSYKQNLISCLYFILTHKFFFNELLTIIHNPQKLLAKSKALLRMTLQAVHSYLDIKKIIVQNNLEKKYDIYLYSYWMANTAVTAVLLNKNSKIKYKKVFTRCHRFDIYEEATETNYIPYRNYILKNIERIYAISIDAKIYLEKKYPLLTQNKIRVSRLGTFNYGINISEKEENILRIVSCSWLRPVKRVHLIFDALNNLNIPIEWTHFGDGEEMSKLQQKQQNLKNKQLSIKFQGHVTNQEILDSYLKEKYNIFINVSESEGVPVSIMEAMSFGKVIIATNVGGTSEIVINDKNGYLLDKNFKLNELEDAIMTIYRMDNSEYKEMCNASLLIWEKRCDAIQNYKSFYQDIFEK